MLSSAGSWWRNSARNSARLWVQELCARHHHRKPALTIKDDTPQCPQPTGRAYSSGHSAVPGRPRGLCHAHIPWNTGPRSICIVVSSGPRLASAADPSVIPPRG